MRKLLLLFIAVIAFACKEEQKISLADMEAYEKEFMEKIKVAKVTIVQMKLDLQELGDSLSAVYAEKLATFEERLNTAEKEYDAFKEVSQKEIWTKNRARLDSLMGYLELQIDTTKTNIEQLTKQ